MERDAGNRNGFPKEKCVAAKRPINIGETLVAFCTLFILLVMAFAFTSQRVSAEPDQWNGSKLKRGKTYVKQPETKPEEVFVVQLKSNADRQEFDSLVKDMNGKLIDTLSFGQNELLIIASESGHALETGKKLSASKEVARVQRNEIYRPHQVPNDQLFSTEWDLNFMKYAQARGLGSGAFTPLIFYVIDTGLTPIGNELAQTALQFDFSDPVKPTGRRESLIDQFGHGTAVSQVACATDNILGFAGMANFTPVQRVSIVSCRITKRLQGTASLVSILTAINFCYKQMAFGAMPIGPVNLSFGSAPPNTLNADPMIQMSAFALRQVGGLLVLSAGNDGQEDNSPELFARRVGAIDQSGNIADFSDTGPFFAYAPGVQVPVYIPYSYILPFFANGTSFASPRWCGAILLVMGALPPHLRTATYADQIVFNTATVTSQGVRVPNLLKALQAAH